MAVVVVVVVGWSMVWHAGRPVHATLWTAGSEAAYPSGFDGEEEPAELVDETYAWRGAWRAWWRVVCVC